MNYDILIRTATEENETEIDSIILDEELLRFPYELFGIPSLEKLYIDDWLAKFEVREKDFENLASLKNLKNLSLIGNGLDFIPRQVGDLESLEKLTIFGNKIKRIPYEITQCKKLKELDLSSNLIEELPDFLLGLANLEILSIGGNPLIRIPRRIDLLTNLKSLDIGSTKITNLPNELLKLDLEEFEIDDTLIEININDKGRMPMSGINYIRERLEYYFDEYKIQLKKKLKLWLANNQINKVFEVLTSEIPELSYYETPKIVVLTSSRYRYIELERRRGTIKFEDEKLELNKLMVSLIDIVEKL